MNKLELAKSNIIEFYEQLKGRVYVSFSGGKDSTVLLHIARKLYPDVEAVFSDTGLEYPEIREFVKTFDNVTWIKPKVTFKEVIEKHGYPVISKENAEKIEQIRTNKSEKTIKTRLFGSISKNGKLCGKLPVKWRYMINAPFKISSKCCGKLKHKPFFDFEKETGKFPIQGVRKQESGLRQQRQGCNMFERKRPTSWAIGSWTDDDVDNYIKENNIELAKVYDMGYERTGCMFCMFGCHLEKESRFDRMKKTHPKQYDYCMNKLGIKKVLDYYLNQQTNLF